MGQSVAQLCKAASIRHVASYFGLDSTGDIDATINGTFGEFAGDSMLFSTATTSWLSSAVSAMPEPSTSLLMLLGLAGIGTARHRILKGTPKRRGARAIPSFR